MNFKRTFILIVFLSLEVKAQCYRGLSLTSGELRTLETANSRIEKNLIRGCTARNIGSMRDCQRLSSGSSMLTCLRENVAPVRDCCLPENFHVCEEEIYFATYSAARVINDFQRTTVNECADFTSSDLTLKYVGSNCSRTRVIDAQMKDFMQKSLAPCLRNSLRSAGFGSVSNMTLTHAGVMADRNHKSVSSHADGKAIDLKQLTFRDQNGRTRTYNFSGAAARSNSGNNNFYEEFRSCWDEQLITHRGCLRPEEPGYFASSGYTDSGNTRHHHHLHIELPRSCLKL